MKQVFKNFMNGVLVPLQEVPDVAFSHGTMGEGYAVLPDDGIAVAPFDATVEVVMPHSHAIGLRSKQGVEVLIHLGLQTKEQEASLFTVFVQQGEEVHAGDKLLMMDMDKLTSNGVSLITPITFTSGEHVQLLKEGHAVVGEAGIIEIN
ncbi:MAG: PTS glucose transporter subunit IIA [Ndongobacter sp.]|nr:PTS glucose transporter subunit IIA [Ndongobacter sp.]